MPTQEERIALGQELIARRLALGKANLTSFAREAGVSRQHLSHIEHAYIDPKRGAVLPSDETLAKIAVAYGIPLGRLHVLMGRFPDGVVPNFKSPHALLLAERFDRLAPELQEAALAAFAAVESLKQAE